MVNPWDRLLPPFDPTWIDMEARWRDSLWPRKPGKHDRVYSFIQIMDALHKGDLQTGARMLKFNKQFPTWRHWHHNVHVEFGIPCDDYCKPRFSGKGSNLIQRIKAAYTIEEIAERHTTLRGMGTLSGPCFLHGGSGSEFVVWSDDQKWKCFGQCGLWGDVIDLVRAMEERGIEWQMSTTL